MQKAFDKLSQTLVDFVDQRERMVLSVFTPEAEAALMLKLLLDLQNSSRNDLFYLITDPFVTADRYVDAIVNRLESEYAADVESGGTELRPIPELCRQGNGRLAHQRLQSCFAYVRSLLPTDLGHRIVWGMAPTEIANEREWERFVLSSIPESGIESWMRGLRWIVRFPLSQHRDDPKTNKFVEHFRFAIPPNAAENELRESLQTHLSSDARAQALVQVAFIDLAHSRTDEATPALRESLVIGQQLEDPAMQALAMLGLGDAAWRKGNIEQSKYWYECAIIPAGESNQIMSLSIIAERLGDIAFQEEKFEDAVIYYEQLVILKRVILDEHGLVVALLKRSRAEQHTSNAAASIVSCQEALLMCHAFPTAHPQDECLSELANAYASVGRRAEGERERVEWALALQGADS